LSALDAIAFSPSHESGIDSHREGAVELFPTGPSPKSAATIIISRDQDNGALNTRRAQSAQTFVNQTPAQSMPSPIGMHRQMINMTAPAVMTAKNNGHDCVIRNRDVTQAGIFLDKERNFFSGITLANFDSVRLLPKPKRCVVIIDLELARENFHVCANK
jgi:hypothetical protein